MRLADVRFLKSATGPEGWPPPDRAEVAFAGRSNVGKSSLINCLVGRKALARVSSKPGRTRALNFIDVDLDATTGLRLCDLPGYGYAKVSKAERARWGKMIEGYLTGRDCLRRVVVIVDVRHPPTELDHRMMEWLCASNVAATVVATKIDKLSKNQRRGAVERTRRELGADAIGFSAATGEGKDLLWRVVLDAIA